MAPGDPSHGVREERSAVPLNRRGPRAIDDPRRRANYCHPKPKPKKAQAKETPSWWLVPEEKFTEALTKRWAEEKAEAVNPGIAPYDWPLPKALRATK